MVIKKAVIITAHKFSQNLIVLQEQLPNTDFFIHVDKKSNIADFAQIKSTFCFVDRVEVTWGHFSQIEATLILLKAVVNKGYDYISFISADDLPLMKEQYIDKFFMENYGDEFIALDGKRCYENRCKYNYFSIHYNKYLNKEIRQRRLSLNYIKVIFFRIFKDRFFINKYFDQLPKIYKGTNWFTITNECADYFLSYTEEKPNYLKAFRKSLCGDELFFQTIFFNSYLKKRQHKPKQGYSVSLRYIDWKAGPEYPKVLTDEDFVRIKGSGNIFARKFQGKHSWSVFYEFLETNQ